MQRLGSMASENAQKGTMTGHSLIIHGVEIMFSRRSPLEVGVLTLEHLDRISLREPLPALAMPVLPSPLTWDSVQVSQKISQV